ncbi:hypothetical protein HU200_062094 [Digitaria exilis]|uniref:Reverse transcriptase zinc-binding domain-containing protein n=1 Tax=Digitaria exilis TaxID=1010633 RepID=A0A835E0A8_9POAL|nr:hypothetical protein HU200_062094 [Digitaria exilis]
METIEHIFFACPQGQNVWARLGIALWPLEWRFPWLIGTNLALPPSVQLDVVLLTLWHIWKARYTAIFGHHTMTVSGVLHRIISDMDSWSCRYKKLITDWTRVARLLRHL